MERRTQLDEMLQLAEPSHSGSVMGHSHSPSKGSALMILMFMVPSRLLGTGTYWAHL